MVYKPKRKAAPKPKPPYKKKPATKRKAASPKKRVSLFDKARPRIEGHAAGMKVIQWFSTVDDLLKSMLANPHDAYHRNPI